MTFEFPVVRGQQETSRFPFESVGPHPPLLRPTDIFFLPSEIT
jgi:hypothetical protein